MEHLSKSDWNRILRENRRLFHQSELYRKVKRQAAVTEHLRKKDGTLSKRIKILGHRCRNCQCLILSHEKLNIDHITPVSSGDSRLEQLMILWGISANLQVLCLECHKGKTKNDRKKRL